jgi:glycosyltransferase involved in cell wall biosynthesis
MMNILYDHQVFSLAHFGGIGRYFVELVSHISGFPDVQARILAPINRSPCLSVQHKRAPHIGLDLARIPGLPDRVIRPVNRFLARGYTRLVTADIVHETGYWPGSIAPKSAKIVATVHDSIPERLPHLFPNLRVEHQLRQDAIDRAHHVICVSQSTRNDLLEFFKVDPARVSVILLGSSICLPAEGPINLGKPYLLHVGARYSYKNFDGLIGGFAKAGLQHTHKLVSFSSKPWSDLELQKMKEARVPLEAMVQTSGDDALLARFYAGADALVFPSMYEGFGIPLLEAMRCGCPIATSNISSMPEVAGDAAVYFEPHDTDSIAQTLVDIVSSAALRKRLTANGLLRAKQFSWERCAEQTYTAYKHVLSHS